MADQDLPDLPIEQVANTANPTVSEEALDAMIAAALRLVPYMKTSDPERADFTLARRANEQLES
jgi:hypothetical protein